MARLNQKLMASTLIESLIAMVIILVCMGIGILIYSNVLNSDKQRLELKAILVLNEEVMKVKKEHPIIDQEKKVGEWRIKQTLQLFEQTENVFKLNLVIIDALGTKIFERNELILLNQ